MLLLKLSITFSQHIGRFCFFLGVGQSSLVGSLLVIIGLYMLLWGKNREAKDSINRIAYEADGVKDEEPKLQVITVSSDSRCP